ncbi:hypothetical protein [Streptomyces sp. NPDC005423]|uniref:hypothetical protein n=1 Tax=Streptomyces sp. NPDC005423 TaxID=3155343 RepID=UPI0033BC80C2
MPQRDCHTPFTNGTGGDAAFAALGGGSVTHAAGPADASRPAAYAAVFLPMAAVALLGAWVTTRLREHRPGNGRAPATGAA